MPSDRELPGRVRPLASPAPTELPEGARERVLSRLRQEGPRLVVRARQRRHVVRFTLAGVALGGVIGLFVVAQRPGHDTERSVARACASWGDLPPELPRALGGAARSAVDVERIARVVLSPGGRAELARRPCELAVTLSDGRVAIHARDLGGGALVVRTPAAELTVHGTIFSVDLAPGVVTLDVAEGAVSLDAHSATHASAHAGERLVLDGREVKRSPLTAVDVAALRTEVAQPAESVAAPAPLESPAPEPSAAPPTRTRAAAATPAQQLAHADALRQGGDLDGARSLYRQVGRGSGSTAEVAWLSLARLEYAAGQTDGVGAALAERERRFGDGALGQEAAWIGLRARRQAGDTEGARRAAEDIIRRWPSSAQAEAARQLIKPERKEGR